MFEDVYVVFFLPEIYCDDIPFDGRVFYQNRFAFKRFGIGPNENNKINVSVYVQTS